MRNWLRQLDDLLRGRKTTPELLAKGQMELPLRTFVSLAVVLGLVYGFFMGWYAVFSRDPACYVQVLASMIKLPALFLLTLVVTFPSLYVFNALVGCRLSFAETLRLLVGAVVVNVAVAASLATILGFFTLSTTSYAFMILLNVVLLGVSGIVALGFLLHTLRRLAAPPPVIPPTVTSVKAGDEGEPQETNPAQREPGPMDQIPWDVPDQALGQARSIFRIWVVIYALVGAQMGWLLRPFIGCPNLPFTWFRQREGNFFQAVVHQIQQLLGAG